MKNYLIAYMQFLSSPLSVYVYFHVITWFLIITALQHIQGGNLISQAGVWGSGEAIKLFKSPTHNLQLNIYFGLKYKTQQDLTIYNFISFNEHQKFISTIDFIQHVNNSKEVTMLTWLFETFYI
jgi:hypothetical protein